MSKYFRNALMSELDSVVEPQAKTQHQRGPLYEMAVRTAVLESYVIVRSQSESLKSRAEVTETCKTLAKADMVDLSRSQVQRGCIEVRQLVQHVADMEARMRSLACRDDCCNPLRCCGGASEHRPFGGAAPWGRGAGCTRGVPLPHILGGHLHGTLPDRVLRAGVVRLGGIAHQRRRAQD